jgi:hypothetical protein
VIADRRGPRHALPASAIEDGKTSTVTTTGVDANGQQRSDVAVEDKQ